MKLNHIIIPAIAFAAATLCACENESFLYQDTARVRLEADPIWSLGTDSLTFSFTTLGADIMEKEISVDAVIMGEVSNTARTANLAVGQARSTANSATYAFPAQVTIPAGESRATFTVTLRRSEEIKSVDAVLYLEVVPSSDFEPGVVESNHVIFKWNDKITRPTNWDSLAEYFGSYSDTKYRFMLANVPSGTEFSTDKMSWSQLMNYKVIFTNALNDYNAAHPGKPMTDENGVLVDFNN
ncbi:MAG: DUF4843 domain-containing protein [Bacteroidales bacterium]|nr:DUF4843 domain-containing protein [Bacteroidales bacterium]